MTDHPSAWVQWKGTDVCLDFRCICDEDFLGHYDGYGAYALECPRCGRVYEVQQTLTLRLAPFTTFPPQKVHDLPEE